MNVVMLGMMVRVHSTAALSQMGQVTRVIQVPLALSTSRPSVVGAEGRIGNVPNVTKTELIKAVQIRHFGPHW